MLYRADRLRRYALGATDGAIGDVEDFYFDDQEWTIRYVVAHTGSWLSGSRVLIAPNKLGPVEADREVIDTGLTRKQIEEQPPADSHKPVSEHFEVLYYPYYGWPPVYQYEPQEQGPEDMHLRSAQEVTGYTVAALDARVGHIEDFIIDDRDWVIRYLVVDTRDWLPGKRVLLSPEWISDVNWTEYKAHVNVTRATIKDSPEYDPDEPVTREYEAALCRHYGKEGYWSRESCPS